MHELAKAVARLRRKDPRFSADAYFFVFEALHYAHSVLKIGTTRHDASSEEIDSEEIDIDDADELADDEDAPEAGEAKKVRGERHLTGQELCEAIRLYALHQFGYMAKCVLNSWGVTETADFGDIVFHLIDAKQMRKTPEDRPEDFHDVFDFDTGLSQSFKISMPEG
jgi:uncharacterized repeat protein (TIGR04138 family)